MDQIFSVLNCDPSRLLSLFLSFFFINRFPFLLIFLEQMGYTEQQTLYVLLVKNGPTVLSDLHHTRIHTQPTIHMHTLTVGDHCLIVD